MTAEFPKTREGLIKLLVENLSKSDTTYVSFCNELEHAANDKELNWFCNGHCAIHRLHNSQQLFCLPKSCLDKLKKEKQT